MAPTKLATTRQKVSVSSGLKIEDLYTYGPYQYVYFVFSLLRTAQEWANNALMVFAGQKPKFACNNTNTFVSYTQGCRWLDADACTNVTLKSDFAG
jgi:hypothetical protein